MKKQEILCPKCNRYHVIKRGYFQTEAHGKQQRYFCKDCNKKFIPKTPFYRMRNNPQKITLCLDLFFKGISTRQVQSHLKQFYPHNSSWVTIYNWVVKYSNLIHNKLGNIKLSVGNELEIDEMEIGKKKSRYNGWFIDSMDTKTRYIVSSEFVKSRGFKEINKVVSRAKKNTNGSIITYTTDGFNVYEKVIKKNAGYLNLKKGLIKHNQVTQLKGGF